MRITRLAPSPTGALHLGNARTFLINWLLARQKGWKIILRIEDIDGPRIKRGADRQAIEDLKWLGLDWDEGPIYQSSRRARYDEAIDRLIEKRVAYPCVCSRKEVDLAASAPHAEDGAAVYPGTCRGKFASVEEAKQMSGRVPAIRFSVPDGEVKFMDEFAGKQAFAPAKQLGDFVIAKADGTPAYQLAVVADDAEMGVTDVVRGDDLLDSTPRQILLYRALGVEVENDETVPLKWHRRGTGVGIPRYWHLPLVVGEDGRRLAKRHGDTRLQTYREVGLKPQRILALLARWCGVRVCGRIEIRELLTKFRIDRVPKARIIFSEQDDAWLRNPENNSSAGL